MAINADLSVKMGCFSSKIMTRSGSFQGELRQSFQRSSNGIEELLNAKNSGDQFLALLYTANTVAKKLKAGPPALEPGTSTEESAKHLNSKAIETEDQDRSTNATVVDSTSIETINAWELLADIEDKEEADEDLEGQQKQCEEGTSGVVSSARSFHSIEEDKIIVNIDSNPSISFTLIEDKCEHGPSGARSFRTVEEYDAMVAGTHLLEHRKDAIESSKTVRECSLNSDQLKKEDRNGEDEGSGMPQGSKDHINIMVEGVDTTASVEESVTLTCNPMSGKGSRRKALAKELETLKVPTFEFSKSGSLREWLIQGGQVFSPGSYLTPKFGSFISPSSNNGEKVSEDAVFDPELVANLEQDMEQLTMEEEYILEQILNEGNVEDTSRIEKNWRLHTGIGVRDLEENGCNHEYL